MKERWESTSWNGKHTHNRESSSQNLTEKINEINYNKTAQGK